MKTMTCKQMGGPCGEKLIGNTADEVIKLQDKHIRQAVANGDSSHQKALDEMNSRWRHPISGMKWYMKAKADFVELPENS